MCVYTCTHMTIRRVKNEVSVSNKDIFLKVHVLYRYLFKVCSICSIYKIVCVYTHTPLAKSFYMYVYRVVPSYFPLCESMVPFQLPMNISHSNSNLSMDQPQLLNQHESTIPVSPKTCDGQVRAIIVPQTNKKISFKFQSPPSNKTQNTTNIQVPFTTYRLSSFVRQGIFQF